MVSVYFQAYAFLHAQMKEYGVALPFMACTHLYGSDLGNNIGTKHIFETAIKSKFCSQLFYFPYQRVAYCLWQTQMSPTPNNNTIFQYRYWNAISESLFKTWRCQTTKHTWVTDNVKKRQIDFELFDLASNFISKSSWAYDLTECLVQFVHQPPHIIDIVVNFFRIHCLEWTFGETIAPYSFESHRFASTQITNTVGTKQWREIVAK